MESTLMREIKSICFKQWQEEIKAPHLYGGLLIQVLASIFIVYLIVGSLNAAWYNALFWILSLFTIINAVSRSFISETDEHRTYLFSMVRHDALILGKIIYNLAQTLVINLITLIVFEIIFGIDSMNYADFAVIAICLSAALTTIITAVSAIASRTGNGFLLTPVLSLPLLIPALLVGIAAAKNAAEGVANNNFMRDVGILVLLTFMVGILSVVLFRFVWKR